ARRIGNGQSRLQASYDAQHAGRAVLEILRGDIEWREEKVAASLEAEALRHDTNDRVRRGVQRDIVTDDAAVAVEERVPCIGAQHDDMRCGTAVFPRGEIAAQRRLHAEQAEKVGACNKL